jgi:hypothetical protein
MIERTLHVDVPIMRAIASSVTPSARRSTMRRISASVKRRGRRLAIPFDVLCLPIVTSYLEKNPASSMVPGVAMKLSELRWLLREASGVFKHKSAVAPILWLFPLFSFPCFILSQRENGIMKVLFVGLATIPLVAFMRAYFGFMNRDPDRLHSEQFQTTSRALDIVAKKAHSLELAPADLSEIASPTESPKDKQSGQKEAEQ